VSLATQSSWRVVHLDVSTAAFTAYDDPLLLVQDHRAASIEDVAFQAQVALHWLDSARDIPPHEQLVAEHVANALRLLYSVVGALQRLGAIKTSAGLSDDLCCAWRSPWLTLQEATSVHQKECGADCAPMEEDSPARTVSDRKVRAFQTADEAV
jgi:hypothetical protein